MTRRPPLPDDDEINAFRQALQAAGVRRLPSNRADPGKPRKDSSAHAVRRQAAVEANTLQANGRTSDGRVEAVRPSEYLEFSVPDLPWRTLSQLKRGQTAWQAGLDLHGYTLEEARIELESFLRESAGQGLRCVLVVHGKAWGTTADYPVLKSHTNTWLREWPGVLAFCSAIDMDGGTGAVYVLLRKPGR
ncbi:DNA mismatch repair protein MutS [Halomonas sp. ZH2S]|uniref:DNA mismatch repair protein MutS n=1 Tax=Vreelandella zhuhanensis TaxID=2684210 RepID=A0A7X3KP27_9GAMM|nr:Smr/MutS family protein [Halomonas zhuhanensis]MWJ26970.1 DNA mismatch repair protein MutS [Halomonas zhuhanensis]